MTAVSLDPVALGLLVIFAAMIHWIVARSEIAQPLWSRARGKLDRLLRCVGCSAVWLGLGMGTLGLRPVHWAVLDHWTWVAVGADVVSAALLAAFGAPIAQATFLWAKDATAIPDPEPPGTNGGVQGTSSGPR
jgi:hypothetical protein